MIVALVRRRSKGGVSFEDFLDAATIAQSTTHVADQEALRHARIDDVIESTMLHAYYDVRTEHDFSDDPRAVVVGSAGSLLATPRSA